MSLCYKNQASNIKNDILSPKVLEHNTDNKLLVFEG